MKRLVLGIGLLLLLSGLAACVSGTSEGPVYTPPPHGGGWTRR